MSGVERMDGIVKGWMLNIEGLWGINRWEKMYIGFLLIRKAKQDEEGTLAVMSSFNNKRSWMGLHSFVIQSLLNMYLPDLANQHKCQDIVDPHPGEWYCSIPG